MADGRSLGKALMSAATTIAVFVVSNWDPGYVTGAGNVLDNICMHIVSAFGAPTAALMNSIETARLVRAMGKILEKTWSSSDQQEDCPNRCSVSNILMTLRQMFGMRSSTSGQQERRSVSALTLCPIFLEIPPDSSSTDEDPQIEGFRSRSAEAVGRLRPLRLRTRHSPIEVITHGRDNHTSSGPNQAGSSTQFLYFELQSEKVSFERLFCRGKEEANEEMRARCALLALGLAPEDEELRFLHSRSRFQSVASFCQASGYVVGVVERMCQNVGISPMEAIVCFLSLLVALQLLVEVYGAGGHFQRPLLLRLTSHEFARLRKTLGPFPFPSISSSSSNGHLRDTIAKTEFHISNWQRLLYILFSLLFLIPCMYYFAHYLHSSLLSSLAVLLFSVAPPILIILALGFGYGFDDWLEAHVPTLIYEFILALAAMGPYFMYGCGMLLGVVSTIKDWKALFNKPTHNFYAWILPHVSS